MSAARVWSGRVGSGLGVAFLLFDAVGKLAKLQPVVDGTTQLGFSEGVIVPIGVALLVCTIAYALPRTAIIGAVLLTGYLGGAVATHVHAGGSAFEIAFPVLFAVIVWGGLALRDPRVTTMWAVR